MAGTAHSPLFQERVRADPSYAGDEEPTWTFLDRVDDLGFDRVRRAINAWFARYPSTKAADLRGRLTSGDDVEFHSAWFELYLHERSAATGRLWRRLRRVHAPHISHPPRRPRVRLSREPASRVRDQRERDVCAAQAVRGDVREGRQTRCVRRSSRTARSGRLRCRRHTGSWRRLHPLSPTPAARLLDADPARRGDALELGHDWRAGADTYRACWCGATGELTVERLDPDRALALDDFHRGVAGPVEVLAYFDIRVDWSKHSGHGRRSRR